MNARWGIATLAILALWPTAGPAQTSQPSVALQLEVIAGQRFSKDLPVVFTLRLRNIGDTPIQILTSQPGRNFDAADFTALVDGPHHHELVLALSSAKFGTGGAYPVDLKPDAITDTFTTMGKLPLGEYRVRIRPRNIVNEPIKRAAKFEEQTKLFAGIQPAEFSFEVVDDRSLFRLGVDQLMEMERAGHALPAYIGAAGGVTEVRDAMLAELTSDNELHVFRAATGLKRNPPEDSVLSPAVDAALRKFLTLPDDRVVMAVRDPVRVVCELAQFHPDRRFIPTLLKLARKPDRSRRDGAMHALQRYFDPEVMDLMAAALDGPEIGMDRTIAISHLAAGGDPRAMEPLLQRVANAKPSDVMADIADLEQYLADPRAAAIVDKALADPDPAVVERIQSMIAARKANRQKREATPVSP